MPKRDRIEIILRAHIYQLPLDDVSHSSLWILFCRTQFCRFSSADILNAATI